MSPTGNKLKHRNIMSFKIDKASLQKILNVLISENKKAQQDEFQQFRKNKVNDIISDENLKMEVEKNLQVSVNVWGRSGEYANVNGIENLSEFPWPTKVRMITMENYFNFELIYKVRPANNFLIKLDFNYTDIFDLTSSPSLKTFNDSKYEIFGTDGGWVHGVESQLNEILTPHEEPLWNFIHSRNIYDFLLWFFYVPTLLISLSNWSKKYPFIEKNFLPSVQPICFLVLLIIGIYIFRIFFNITKRIFPFASLKGDLKEPTDIWSIGRGILYFLVTSILGTILSQITGY